MFVLKGMACECLQDPFIGHHHPEGCHWPVSEEQVRVRAYFISLETGGYDPVADWLRAEAEYWAEAGRVSNEWVTGTGQAS